MVRTPATSERWLSLSLNAIAHAAALVRYFGGARPTSVPATWSVDFSVLLALSLAAATAQQLAVGRRAWTVGLLAGRVLLIGLLGYPMGTEVHGELLLLAACTWDVVVFLRFRVAMGAAAALLGLVLLLQGSHHAWGVRLPPVTWDGLLLLAAYPGLVAAIGLVVRGDIERTSHARRLMAQLNESALSLAQTNIELQDAVVRRENEATLAERRRVSRDVHDTMGYTLMNIILSNKAALDLRDPTVDGLRTYLAQNVRLAQEGLSETRKALHLLREQAAERSDLCMRLLRLARAFDSTHLSVHVELGNIALSYGADIDDVVYRSIQEGITNAIRHGGATSIAIHLWLDERGELLAIVTDNGAGLGRGSEGGSGLRGIGERLAAFGGDCSLADTAVGCRLSIRIPLRAVPGNA
jgi:signal transduction histidine kinase